MPTKRLSRRAMLRGLIATGGAIAVPLPILDAMLNNNGTAFAAGQAIPKRYCIWFFGNGILPPLWNPVSTGSDWALTDELAPLMAHKENLTVVSGLARKTTGTDFHPAGSAACTTGGPVVSNSAANPSIDQIVANIIGKTTAFKSLEIGVSNATPNGSQNTLHAISHRGANAPNPPEFDPHAVFARVFANVKAAGTTTPPATNDQLVKLNQAKKSVLDSIITDGNELSKQLGVTDQQRLAAHLDGIRSIEGRLTAIPAVESAGCAPPTDPTKAGVLKDSKSEAPTAVNNVQADLLAMAFTCDVTRVASFVFTLPAAHVYYRGLGTDMNDDFHDTICHTDPGDNAHQTRVHRGVVYAMQCLAVFLDQMKAQTEGAGTMLDNSLIHVTSDVSWGKIHTSDEWPVLLIGKGGGAITPNRHVRFAGQNLSNVLFSIGNAFGANLTTLGSGLGVTTTGLSGLFT